MKGLVIQTSILTLGVLSILGSSGGSSDNKETAPVVEPDITPTTPINLKATSAYKSVLLSWSTANNASSYELCYAMEPIDTYSDCSSYSGGTISNIGSNTSTAVKFLTVGQPYYFRVLTINSEGEESTASDSASATPNLGLNDTGITVCREDDSINVACPSELFPNQDADHGQDAIATDNTDGSAGFNFTKLNAVGEQASEEDFDWSCATDNTTGLTWEVKLRTNAVSVIGDDGLHDADDSFSWYDTNSSSNAGTRGETNSAANICYGYDASDSSTYCNTEAFIARVNAEAHCGLTNWRLPTREELNSIINYDEVEPAVDLSVFPYTASDVFWSTTSVFSNTTSGEQAWGSNFNYGGSGKVDKTENHNVRLVSDGQ